MASILTEKENKNGFEVDNTLDGKEKWYGSKGRRQIYIT